MEQVKKCPKRVAALVLACFVVAFSVSVPAAAASNLNGNALMRVILDFQDGGSVDSSIAVNYPLTSSGLVMPSYVVPSDSYLTRSRTWLYFSDLLSGESYRLHVRFRGFINAKYTDITSQYVAMSYLVGDEWKTMPFVEVSLKTSFDEAGYIYDLVSQFDFPVDGTQVRIIFTSYFTPYFTSGSASTGLSAIDFMDIDPVIDQTPADKNETNRVDGAVSDKTQQSGQITDQMNQLQKPNVDSSSGKPVVGGMVVDPMQQVDRDSFSAYTNVIGAIFGSSTILSYFIIVFSLIFVGYVIFGKSG